MAMFGLACLAVATVIQLFLGWRSERMARMYRESALMIKSSEEAIVLAMSAARLGGMALLDNAGEDHQYEHLQVLQLFREADRAAIKQMLKVEETVRR